MGRSTRRHRKPENWMAAVDERGHGIDEERPLDPDTRATEALMMGLRLAEGVDLADIALRTGLDPASMIDRKAITHLAEQGLISLSGSRLAVTPQGMLLLDAILATLL